MARRPGAELAAEAVDVILNPSASHFAFRKHEVRRRLVLEGSRAFGVTYVYSNLVGNEAGRIIYDGGALIASAGRLRATGPRFTFQSFHLTTAVVDVDATRMAQSRTSSFTPEVGGRHDDRVTVPFTYPKIAPEAPVVENPTWESGKSCRSATSSSKWAAFVSASRSARTRGWRSAPAPSNRSMPSM